MTAAEIAQRAGARPYRDGFRGPCPVHHGKSGTSFSVHQGEGGRVLLRCWRGCSTTDILGALGLRWADLFDGPREARPEDSLDAGTRRSIAIAQENLRQHPARGTFRDEELCVMVSSGKDVDAAIAHALAAAVQGELVQVVPESEVGQCHKSAA